MADAEPCPEHRLNRLRFRAWRRGFREADLVLGGFLDASGAGLEENEISQFEALLNVDDDHLIYAWVGERAPVPAEHDTALLKRIRAFMRDDVAATIDKGVT